MLLGAGRHHRSNITSARDSVHNYYEKIVIDELLSNNNRAKTDSEFLADVACVALNHLPPKYVRHDVDMTFFLSPNEHHEILDKVAKAVSDAASYVEGREHKKEKETKNG